MMLAVVTLPYSWMQYYASVWLSWLIHFLSMGGVQPRGYIPASKLTELNSMLDHLHAREDLYRKAIRELQEEIHAKDSDRKRAMRKLKTTKEEIAHLTESLSFLRREYEHGVGTPQIAGKDAEESDSILQTRHVPSHHMGGGYIHVSTHISFMLLLVLVWMFSKLQCGALQWKIVLSVFFPVRIFRI